tara:strand:- start:185 stop:625 length:441 start_codon:yes stop_codon:yes gene_type:complete
MNSLSRLSSFFERKMTIVVLIVAVLTLVTGVVVMSRLMIDMLWVGEASMNALAMNRDLMVDRDMNRNRVNPIGIMVDMVHVDHRLFRRHMSDEIKRTDYQKTGAKNRHGNEDGVWKLSEKPTKESSYQTEWIYKRFVRVWHECPTD